MRIWCLSDLHLSVPLSASGHIESPKTDQIHCELADLAPDIVVITGDTVLPQYLPYLGRILTGLFGTGLQIVATLGNHEFWGRTFEETLNCLREQQSDFRNIHFLDIGGSFQTQGINFVGGCLFFDGSMRIRENQRITPWDGWNDRYIKDIERRYLEFNCYYTDMISANMKPGKPTILCTHHVPHALLTAPPPSHYNFYCGMKDFVHELPFDSRHNNYLICGHTHRRLIGEIIPGFMCVNVGSDYGQLQYFLLDL